MTSVAALQRRRLRVCGVVQGVGFRPHVHRLATDEGVTGFVGNDAAGVFIEVEGHASQLDRFGDRLRSEAPPLARIDRIDVETVAVCRSDTFTIVESTPGGALRSLIPPDVSVCDSCVEELRNPADRRYRYPFINCTDCGPRFTIIEDLPYDRPATTMAAFPMCAPCRCEYDDPSDRRYHAQPIACPHCGPQLSFECGNDVTRGTDAVLAAMHTTISSGRIVAVKGLGGFHLACDATDDDAVSLLRRRKGRADKPFAVMVPDLDAARELAVVSPAEAEALSSPARPIVLLQKQPRSRLADSVAPGNPLIGIMLPYTPLHVLLFDPIPGRDTTPPSALVMTSGNLSNEPICHVDDDARTRLAALADAFCTNDRPIEVPCDDSVVRVIDGRVQPIRRSRGYAPVPVALPVDVAPTLAVGGELKNTFCLASGGHAWVSQHIGDMENIETLRAFERSVDGFVRMYDVAPAVLAADRHPDYLTSRWARHHAGERRLVEVQHHHAHVASVMAEHGLDGTTRVIGVAFDGTGYGVAPDGAVQSWGGEVLVADYDGFERVGHLAPMPLPGGDAGVRNPCRTAVAYLTACGLEPDRSASHAACDDDERRIIGRQVTGGIGCTPTTSMGRLFDVVASLLGIRHRVSYEAQAAIELETVASEGNTDRWPLEFEVVDGIIDPGPVLAGLLDGVAAGAARPDLARSFHEAVVRAVADLADSVRQTSGLTTVALTGGVFQNALLASATTDALHDLGFEVLTHRLVPPNDGGLALGQAVIAGRQGRIDQPQQRGA